MELLAEIFAIVGRVLTKWFEFTAYAIQLILYGPFMIMIIAIAVFAPFVAIWYAVTHRDGYALWITVCLIAAALLVFFRRSNDHNDDDPPVRRGRSLLSSDQVRRTNNSKLRR